MSLDKKPDVGIDDPGAGLIAKINAAMAACGSNWQHTRVPDDLPGYKSLKGRRIMQIDDSDPILESFAPNLVVATDGNFTPLLYSGQSEEDVVAAVVASGAEIVLMDYSLDSDNMNGARLTEALRRKGLAIKIIGFTSEGDSMRFLISAGADGCVVKKSIDSVGSILRVAEFVEGLKQ